MGFPCVASLDGNPLFHELVLVLVLVLVVVVVVAVAVVVAAVVNVVNFINHNKPTYHLGMVHTIHFLGLPSLSSSWWLGNPCGLAMEVNLWKHHL